MLARSILNLRPLWITQEKQQKSWAWIARRLVVLFNYSIYEIYLLYSEWYFHGRQNNGNFNAQLPSCDFIPGINLYQVI